jgi:hypothetical protein
MSKTTWDPTFGPCYSPEQMLKLGVFEGKYINALKGLPASWKKIDKVLSPTDQQVWRQIQATPLRVERQWLDQDRQEWLV